MKKSTKPNKSATISYEVSMYVRNVGNTPNAICHATSEEEFKDANPLTARNRAFEYIEKTQADMLDATRLGIIHLASYEQAKQRGFTNYTAHDFTIICSVTDNDGNILFREPIDNSEGQETAIWGLEREYYYYQRYGYETGKTMELDDGELILWTDPQFIYE